MHKVAAIAVSTAALAVYVTRKRCTRLLAVNKPRAYLCHYQATEHSSGLTGHSRRQKSRR